MTSQIVDSFYGHSYTNSAPHMVFQNIGKARESNKAINLSTGRLVIRLSAKYWYCRTHPFCIPCELAIDQFDADAVFREYISRH